MSEPGAPSEVSIRNGVSNALARIMREFYGKGPARTRTYLCDAFVFSMLDDVLTPVERAIKDGGRSDLVRRIRLRFEDMMTSVFVGEVERLTGVRVLAYHSQVVFDPDMAIEVFVLEQAPRGADRAAEGPEVRSARSAGPGKRGDADALPGPSDDRPVLGPERGSPASAADGDGQVRAAIANSMVRLLYEYWGKGPIRAKAYIEDQFVFAVLEDPLTTVERTLVGGGEHDVVRDMRLEFHELSSGAFAAEVERATGRRVRASHCQVVFDPDIVFEIFVLEGDVDDPEAGISAEQADVSAAGAA